VAKITAAECSAQSSNNKIKHLKTEKMRQELL
jgi:hypothetical protein